MTWRLLIHQASGGIGWVQWVNREAADAWRRELELLLAAPPPDQAIPENLEAQATATKAIWYAVNCWRLAVNLPFAVFVPYARAQLVTNPDVWRAEAVQALNRFSPEFPNNEATVQVIPRLEFLTNDATVYDRWVTATIGPDPERGVDDRRTSIDALHGSIWTAWTWSEWYPGAFTAGDVGAVIALLPLKETYELGRSMAGFIVGRTTEEAVDVCRNYAAAKNFATARAIDPSTVPAEAAELIVSTGSADRLLNTRISPELADAAAIGAGVSPLIAIASPWAALAAGLALGLGAALQSIFGTAIGYNVDGFNRREPVLEETSISGQIRNPASASTPPTQTVPMPARTLVPFLPIWNPNGGEEYRASHPATVDPVTPPKAAAKSGAAKMGALAFAAWLLSNSMR